MIENKTLICTKPTLTKNQMAILNQLNDFAIHQCQYNYEVRMMPAKSIYKVNEELKLAIVALMLTCSILDPNRHGTETEKFFTTQIRIIQTNNKKIIDFGQVRPFLIQNFLIPEIVDDWILYRDICGDGIHALIDRKTFLQGLENYHAGGSPAYEFARFYRKLMEQKLSQQQSMNQQFQTQAIQSLANQMIQQQLNCGLSPNEILQNITHNTLLNQPNSNSTKLLKSKK